MREAYWAPIDRDMGDASVARFSANMRSVQHSVPMIEMADGSWVNTDDDDGDEPDDEFGEDEVAREREAGAV